MEKTLIVLFLFALAGCYTSSAANRADFYATHSRGVDTKDECVDRIESLLARSVEKTIFMIDTQKIDTLDEGKKSVCRWERLRRDNVIMLKSPQIGEFKEVYGVGAECAECDVHPVALFDSKADAELFQVLLYRMIDLQGK